MRYVGGVTNMGYLNRFRRNEVGDTVFESHYLDRVYLEMFEIVGSHGEHELDSLSGVLSCVST